MFVAVADVHLGFKLKGIETDYAVRHLRFAVERAEYYNCPLVILGDLFDSVHPSSYVVEQAIRTISHPEMVYFIEGQHEYANTAWLHAIFPGRVTSLSANFGVEVGGFRVGGFDHSYTFAEDFEDMMKGKPEIDIFVMHQLIDGLQVRHDITVEYLTSFLTGIPILAGDYHDAISIGPVHYAGSWCNYTGRASILVVDKSLAITDEINTSIPPIKHITFDDIEKIPQDADCIYLVHLYPYEVKDATTQLNKLKVKYSIKRRTVKAPERANDVSSSSLDISTLVKELPLEDYEKDLVMSLLRSDDEEVNTLLEAYKCRFISAD